MSDPIWKEVRSTYEPGAVVRATVSVPIRRTWWERLLRRPVQYRQERRYYRATGQTATAKEPTWPTR